MGAALRALVCTLGVVAAWGCGDSCEQLCQRTAQRLAECKPDALAWVDLGATSRRDFVETCRDDWDRTSADLSANDLRIALELCDSTDVEALSCDEITALYAGE